MGRPVKRYNGGSGTQTKRMAQNTTGDQFMILAKISGQSIAECTIIAQRGDNKFYVTDGSNNGIVTLVNKKEQANALTTDVPSALNDGEAIMNCRKDATQGNAVRRVMKLMNRTLIYSDDDSPTEDNYKTGTSLKRAKWSFTASDRDAPTGHDGVYVLETVQLEEAEANSTSKDFVADAA